MSELSIVPWKKLIELCPDSIFISKIDSFDFVEVNKRACDYYGYTKREFLNMQIFDIEVDTNLVSEIRRYYNKTHVGDVFEIFGHNKRKDGTTFPAHVRFTKINKKIAMASVRDISIFESQMNCKVWSNRLVSKKMAKIIPKKNISKREVEVFQLIGKGRSCTEIASQLGLNIKTISTYRNRLIQKLNLKNNTELIQYAFSFA